MYSSRSSSLLSRQLFINTQQNCINNSVFLIWAQTSYKELLYIPSKSTFRYINYLHAYTTMYPHLQLMLRCGRMTSTWRVRLNWRRRSGWKIGRREPMQRRRWSVCQFYLHVCGVWLRVMVCLSMLNISLIQQYLHIFLK